MRIETGAIKKLHIVHLNPGDDVLVGLREAVRRLGIRHAAILGAIGSVTSYHFHVVASPAMPPAELYPKGEGAYDIAAMTGYVFAGRVHCHILFSDDKIAFGGHLEEGCRVLTFNVVTLAELADMDITNFDMLQPLD